MASSGPERSWAFLLMKSSVMRMGLPSLISVAKRPLIVKWGDIRSIAKGDRPASPSTPCPEELEQDSLGQGVEGEAHPPMAGVMSPQCVDFTA